MMNQSQPFNFFNRFFFGLMLALISGCSSNPEPSWSGYAEGDYVYIASPLAGRLDSLPVTFGQEVIKDQLLFGIDSQSEQISQQEALARYESAQSQTKNLETGKRKDEVAVIHAQLEQAQASETLALSDLKRQQQLATQGFVSKARLEDAYTALTQVQAKVAELKAALKVAYLPARQDEREAQSAATLAAKEVLNQNKWRTQQKQQFAPQTALIADIFFRVGEFVQAGQAVISLLPSSNIKARFFVPETDMGILHAGQTVMISCDGCGAPFQAQITRIATKPEYTPPVIYSNAQRSKLVFMVEAKPALIDAHRLKPGQPLDVHPLLVSFSHEN